jgi:hypothetical protein
MESVGLIGLLSADPVGSLENILILGKSTY